MNVMSASISGTSVDGYAPGPPVDSAHPDRPRQITFRAGRALEMLGHAIEYLSDESFGDESAGALEHLHLEAVQILMSRTHEVYFACPPVLTLRERWHSFLHPHRA